eukprot:c4028_g1_i1.p1 GENE.c4028_g1_i1~~c4028_g1_i1.p1  ORF type:complete len:195 (+),score=38.54 c4028_g1_i1:119-703(+)
MSSAAEVGPLLVKALDYFRNHPSEELTAEQFEERGLVFSQGLGVQLQKHDKFIYDQSKKTYKFCPRYRGLTNRDDIMKLLQNRNETAGIKLDELSESYTGVTADIEELKRDGQIILIENSRTETRVFEDSHLIHIDDRFKTQWSEIPLTDMIQKLEQHDLPVVNQLPKVLQRAETNKSKTNTKRQRNRTNTHLD